MACTPERALQGVVYQIVQRMSTPRPGIFGVVRPGQGTAPSRVDILAESKPGGNPLRRRQKSGQEPPRLTREKREKEVQQMEEEKGILIYLPYPDMYAALYKGGKFEPLRHMDRVQVGTMADHWEEALVVKGVDGWRLAGCPMDFRNAAYVKIMYSCGIPRL